MRKSRQDDAGENPVLTSTRQRLDGAAIPSQVIFELTHACNLRCGHCYLEYHRSEDEMDTAMWQRMVDQVLDLGVYFVGFTGGEILIRPDFFDIARYARDRGLFFYLQTNGSCINRDNLDAIIDLNPTKVEISLYGASAGTHDAVTGIPGSFQKTWTAIQMLRERQVRVPIKSTVLNINCHEVALMEKLAHDVGTVCIPDPMVMPGAYGSKETESLRMNDAQFRQFMIDHHWDRKRPADPCAQEDPEARKGLRLICSAGRKSCAIGPEGDVLPCVLWRQSAGSVHDRDLVTIWHDSIFSRIRNLSIKDLKKCVTCSTLGTCVRCAALAYIETGDITASATECCRMSSLLGEVKLYGGKAVPRS